MVSVLQEVLGAGAAGRVVVRLDGRGDKVAILDIRVDRDDGDVGCARSFKRWPHALEVDGVEEDDGDALVDEVLNLLVCFSTESAGSRESNTSPCFSTSVRISSSMIS